MSHRIRSFASIDDYRACVELQEAAWGAGFSERVPVAILKVSRVLGGVAAGAFDEGGELLGFVFGMTGVMDGEVVHWSDMLAVRPELRGSGLGWELKGFQRKELLGRGITLMRWTFDPLESANAHLNLNKLGVVVRDYVEDMYGQTDSPLHAGIGTDRFVPHWEMESARVVERMEAGLPGPDPAGREGACRALAAVDDAGPVRPSEPALGLEAERLLVAIPSSIQRVKTADPSLALEWRMTSRAALSHYLGRGYEVTALYRAGSSSDYLLSRTESESP